MSTSSVGDHLDQEFKLLCQLFTLSGDLSNIQTSKLLTHSPTNDPLLLAAIEQWRCDHDKEDFLETLNFICNMVDLEPHKQEGTDDVSLSQKEAELFLSSLSSSCPVPNDVLWQKVTESLNIQSLNTTQQVSQLDRKVSSLIPPELTTRMGRMAAVLNKLGTSQRNLPFSELVNARFQVDVPPKRNLHYFVNECPLNPYQTKDVVSHEQPSFVTQFPEQTSFVNHFPGQPSFVNHFADQDKKTTKKKPINISTQKGEKKTKVKTNQPNSFPYEIHHVNSIIVMDSEVIPGSQKIAAFDMDYTLITTKSGRKFPTNFNDWQFLNDSVVPRLQELKQQGFKIVIITNQGGIEKSIVQESDVTQKIMDIATAVGIPIQAFIATSPDDNSKPATGMWDLLVNEYNHGIQVDKASSFFVGDAAGRPASLTHKKDFSCSDRKFAFNIGISFFTETEFFFRKSEKEPFSWLSAIDLDEICGKTENLNFGDYVSKEQEMIISCGPPASGKSTFTKRYLIPASYIWINRDTLGNIPQCLSLAKNSINRGQSVVIDNTNPDRASRSVFINLAKEANIPVRCFVFETQLDLAQHLNFVRVKMTKGSIRRIPDIAYNMYKKKWQEPTLEEGFKEIKHIPFVPSFDSEEHATFFKQYT